MICGALQTILWKKDIMTLEQPHAFVAVAEREHVTRAAEHWSAPIAQCSAVQAKRSERDTPRVCGEFCGLWCPQGLVAVAPGGQPVARCTVERLIKSMGLHGVVIGSGSSRAVMLWAACAFLPCYRREAVCDGVAENSPLCAVQFSDNTLSYT